MSGAYRDQIEASPPWMGWKGAKEEKSWTKMIEENKERKKNIGFSPREADNVLKEIWEMEDGGWKRWKLGKIFATVNMNWFWRIYEFIYGDLDIS